MISFFKKTNPFFGYAFLIFYGLYDIFNWHNKVDSGCYLGKYSLLNQLIIGTQLIVFSCVQSVTIC